MVRDSFSTCFTPTKPPLPRRFQGKKVEVKIETPAVPSREETPVAPPTVNESTANSKRKKPQQRETQTEPVPVEKEVFERTIPIE